MKNYQNPFGFNPNMGNQQGFVAPPQHGLVYGQSQTGPSAHGPVSGAGYGPEEMHAGMNFPQMGYPGAGFPQDVQGSYPYPVQQHMMEDDCGCGDDPEVGEAVSPAEYNPYGPGMAPSMMAPHGPHGPGCGCGQPMSGPGMMGGFSPQGPAVGPMSGLNPQGPGIAPAAMGGFGPGGPSNPGMMAPQNPGMGPNMMMPHGPHGPGCTCGQPHGPMSGPGMGPEMMAPQNPGMGPNMMMPHGPHGPGCTCGQPHGPMGGPGMMGGFGR